MMKYSDYKKQLEHDPEYLAAKEELRLAFDFGNAVLRARLKRGWSQTNLARQVGTKQANISRIEAGLANPTLELIRKVCKALDLEIEFYDTVKNKPAPGFVTNTDASVNDFSAGDMILAPDWPVKKKFEYKVNLTTTTRIAEVNSND